MSSTQERIKKRQEFLKKKGAAYTRMSLATLLLILCGLAELSLICWLLPIFFLPEGSYQRYQESCGIKTATVFLACVPYRSFWDGSSGDYFVYQIGLQVKQKNSPLSLPSPLTPCPPRKSLSGDRRSLPRSRARFF